MGKSSEEELDAFEFSESLHLVLTGIRCDEISFVRELAKKSTDVFDNANVAFNLSEGPSSEKAFRLWMENAVTELFDKSPAAIAEIDAFLGSLETKYESAKKLTPPVTGIRRLLQRFALD